MTSPANFSIGPEPLEVWQAAWRSTNDRHPWLVAISETESVIGFAKSSPWKTRAAYAWAAEVSVYIRPDHHGRGIGKAIAEALGHDIEEPSVRSAMKLLIRKWVSERWLKIVTRQDAKRRPREFVEPGERP